MQIYITINNGGQYQAECLGYFSQRDIDMARVLGGVTCSLFLVFRAINIIHKL